MSNPFERLPGRSSLSRNRLIQALMTLMQEKDYTDITVTDLTQAAGVSRMAFYRSFSSKEDVINRFMAAVGEQIHSLLSADILRSPVDYFELLFRELGQYARLIRSAVKANLGEMILEHIERYMKMSYPESAYYRLCCASGAFYNMLLHWIMDGQKESPHRMAEIYISMNSSGNLSL